VLRIINKSKININPEPKAVDKRRRFEACSVLVNAGSAVNAVGVCWKFYVGMNE